MPTYLVDELSAALQRSPKNTYGRTAESGMRGASVPSGLGSPLVRSHTAAEKQETPETAAAASATSDAYLYAAVDSRQGS